MSARQPSIWNSPDGQKIITRFDAKEIDREKAIDLGVKTLGYKDSANAARGFTQFLNYRDPDARKRHGDKLGERWRLRKAAGGNKPTRLAGIADRILKRHAADAAAFRDLRRKVSQLESEARRWKDRALLAEHELARIDRETATRALAVAGVAHGE